MKKLVQNWWDFGIDIIQNLCYIKTIKRTHERETEMNTIPPETITSKTAAFSCKFYRWHRTSDMKFIHVKVGDISYDGNGVLRFYLNGESLSTTHAITRPEKANMILEKARQAWQDNNRPQ